MPRDKRVKSKTGVYHVMMRGNERKEILRDVEDKDKFINIVLEKKQISGYELYAYCIMNNHVHLLIKEGEPLSKLMKRINVSYAYYYNKKYDRVGHVFQDRYKSEPIEDEGYLLAALRYIHNNPVKAKITNTCKEYKWSSYRAYIEKQNEVEIIDKELILSLFSKDINKAIKLFIEFSSQANDDKFSDVDEDENKKNNIEISGHLNVEKYLEDYLKKSEFNLEDLKDKVNTKKRNELISYLRNKSNLSIRDIAKLLDINRGVIGRIK